MNEDKHQQKILLFANTAWYLYNFRLQLAKDLRAEGYDVVLASPMDDYVERIEEEGFEWVLLDVSRRGLNPWKELRSILQITRSYRSLQPDLVCQFTLKSVLYGSIAARLVGTTAVLNAITGLGYLYSHQSFGARLQRSVMLLTSRYALNHKNSLTVFQNRDDQDEFVGKGVIPAERARIIPGSGVDIDRFVPEDTSIDDGKGRVPTVLMISRMLWDKGVGEVVEASRILKKRGITVRFILAGAVDEGNPSSVQAEELQGWDEEGLLEWPGFVENIPDLLNESDIVMLPSKYREGVPRSLIEAAAAGKPLIATDVPGCTDIVQDGYNGRVVPAGDAGALAEAVQELAADFRLRAEMGAAGRVLVEKRFSSVSVNRQMVDLMNQMLGRNKD